MDNAADRLLDRPPAHPNGPDMHVSTAILFSPPFILYYNINPPTKALLFFFSFLLSYRFSVFFPPVESTQTQIYHV